MSDLGRAWPAARMGPIGRARALAASIPSAAWTEGVLVDAPYDSAWPWVADLGTSVLRFGLRRSTQGARVEPRWRVDGAGAAAHHGRPPFQVWPSLRRSTRGWLLPHAGPRPPLRLVVMAASSRTTMACAHVSSISRASRFPAPACCAGACSAPSMPTSATWRALQPGVLSRHRRRRSRPPRPPGSGGFSPGPGCGAGRVRRWPF